MASRPPSARSQSSPLFNLSRGPNKEIFAAAWKALRLPGGVPPVTVGALPRGVAATQSDTSRDVTLSPSYAAALERIPFGHKLAGDPAVDALRVLLHEYVHTAQPRPLEPWRREAGATIYSERELQPVLRRMGLGPVSRSGPYAPYHAHPADYPLESAFLRAAPGVANFVNRAQFGEDRMSEWWESPYKGGPMVAVPGFPRPLYPPDAKGKTPSVDGDDVIAYKRTISRAGRWNPWDPSEWDDSFSNAFSHGRPSGNVGDSGIAGFQRQMKIEPTGQVGEVTFNAMRSARVPNGPHKDEMCMDANAANLIANAFKVFAGKPPAPPSAESTRALALEGALSWLGYKESPAGSNDSHFGRWYGMNYQPWCAMAVTHWYEIEGGGSKAFAQGAAYSYCPYILHDAQVGKGGLSITNSPIPGDVVLFDWEFDGVPDHVGLFIDGSPSSFESVEGNTSTSNNSNGGEVMRRSRRSSDAKITFVRVEET